MINKMGLLNLLNTVLRPTPYCNLCFMNISVYSDKCVSIQDEVVVKFKERKLVTDMSEILSSILGAQFIRNWTSGNVCCKCSTLAIKSYTFLKMCKENIESLTDTLSIITKCTEYLPCQKSSLFVIPDTQSSKCNIVLNDNLFSTKTDALKVINETNNKYNDVKLPKILRDNTKKFSIETSSSKKQKLLNKRGKAVPLSKIVFDADDKNNLKCKICLRDHEKLRHLRRHYIRVHVPKSFQCSKCARSYGAVSLLNQHIQDSHTSKVCSECGKILKNGHAMKIHELSHQTSIICQGCGKSYKNKLTYKSHLKNNNCKHERRKPNEEAKFVCDTCDKKYCSKPALRVHIKFEHGFGEVHICKCCNKRFPALSSLREHIVTHTKEKNYTCEVCGGKYVTKTSLLYHTRIHTGERPYSCKYCGLSFLSSSRRADHIRRLHVSLFLQCDLCSKNFKNHASLNRHKKTHMNPKSKFYLNLNKSDITIGTE